MKLIQSLARAFDIINCFDEDNKNLKLKEISEKVNLNINTTRGIVNTLVYYGYLEHLVEENEYSLGCIFLSKYNIIKEKKDDIVIQSAEDLLSNIANTYLVTARLHLVRGNSIIKLISKEPQKARYILQIKDSFEFPLNATSSGKLILHYSDREFLDSYLDNVALVKLTENTLTTKEKIIDSLEFIKENNYSIEIEEAGEGISSLALPVIVNNILEYTVSVSGPTSIVLNNKDAMISKLENVAKNIMNNIE